MLPRCSKRQMLGEIDPLRGDDPQAKGQEQQAHDDGRDHERRHRRARRTAEDSRQAGPGAAAVALGAGQRPAWHVCGHAIRSGCDRRECDRAGGIEGAALAP